MKIKIDYKKAHEIAKRKGLDIDGDGTTFYAYEDECDEIFSFDTKKERDEFIK